MINVIFESRKEQFAVINEKFADLSRQYSANTTTAFKHPFRRSRALESFWGKADSCLSKNVVVFVSSGSAQNDEVRSVPSGQVVGHPFLCLLSVG